MQPDFGRDYREETDREMKNLHKTDNTGIGTDIETPLDHKTAIEWKDHLTVHDQETTPLTNTLQQTVNTGHDRATFNKHDMTDIDKS